MANEDGRFSIMSMSDGVYIELSPAKGDGKPVEITDIVESLNQKNIHDYDLLNVMNALDALAETMTFKITPSDNSDMSTQSLAGFGSKEYLIYTSTDDMRLYIKFFKTDQPKEQISADEIMEELRIMKVKTDVDIDYMQQIISDLKYNKEYILASGKPMIQSTEPTIIYKFKTEKDFRPEVDAEGNVNYHKIDSFAAVAQGQELAQLVPGTDGAAGVDVYGIEHVPKKFKPLKLKRGKNVTISKDGLTLIADVNGLVKLDDGKVSVNNTYNVPSNVGSTTGDIAFDGSVIVHGNVQTGYKLSATGDIDVQGVVEGAIIEAGGNITLHRGIQGMNRCLVKAEGDVIARYIENAEVFAGGIVHSEAILHSNVTARGNIKVEGKKGMITGGTVRSGSEISANIMGSNMGTVTNIEVGIDPLTFEEYNTLLKEIPKNKQEVEKLEQVINLLNKRKELEGELDEQKKSMYLSATRNKIFLTNKIMLAERRVEELKEDVERRNDGKIKVQNIIYPGVRISIGSAKYYVRDELQYACLYKDGADVKLTSL